MANPDMLVSLAALRAKWVGLNGIETQGRPRRLGQPLGWMTQHRWCWEGKRPEIDDNRES